ncbi:skin secretory protein xP2 [Iris pallida]|uniref:Skin secretory protein xP2 n=1 Tax=Iris pallida TaxID=29817 RepID=A0AAX6F7F0_IRIPA|nr:skin secretory protein xP2 [Iris pallida]
MNCSGNRHTGPFTGGGRWIWMRVRSKQSGGNLDGAVKRLTNWSRSALVVHEGQAA